MVSARRQPLRAGARRTATAVGEIAVEEFGYGLGPPSGMLVLRYPPTTTVPDFPDQRNDFVHQVFWSPDGVLTVRRGSSHRFLSPDEVLWVRRGVTAEIRALDVQTVLRVCVRQAPAALCGLSAAALDPGDAARESLLDVARPGVTEEAGLAVRAELLDTLARVGSTEVGHVAAGSGPAHDVARALVHDPSDPTSLTDWAARVHVSAKTLQRHFEQEYAMSFTAWRTRTRLQASMALLHHLPVTEAAHRVGYGSASAFVAAFTREFGTTPGRLAATHSGRAADCGTASG